MAPSKFGSIRSRTRPTGLGSPFRDDSIVTFRYEHTVASTPPIPVGPTKPSSISLSHSQAHSLSQSCSSQHLAPISCSAPPYGIRRRTLVRSTSCSTFGPVSAASSSISLHAEPSFSRSHSTTNLQASPGCSTSAPNQQQRPLSRAASSSAVSSVPLRALTRPPSTTSALRRKPSTLAAAVAATRNPPPPPPVEDHPLFRDSVPNSPASVTFDLPTLIKYNSGASDHCNTLPSGLARLSQSNSTRSASTRASSTDQSDSFWNRSSSFAGTASSASTICEGSISEQDSCVYSAAISAQRRSSRKREHALISKSLGRRPSALAPTFTIPNFGPASAAVSPTEPPSPFSKPLSRNISSAASSRSVSPTFGAHPCSPLFLDVVHETQVPQETSVAIMAPTAPRYNSLDAATNSIVVDARLSFDLAFTNGGSPYPRHFPETPLPIPDQVAQIVRPGAVSPAASDMSSCYSTAPQSVSSNSATSSDKRSRRTSAFGLRSMSSVRNRFRRRSPTDVTPLRHHESAIASVTSSVGRYSLSASRTSGTSGSDAFTTTTTPMQSSFLGVSRLSLHVGGSRSRPTTANTQAEPTEIQPQKASESSATYPPRRLSHDVPTVGPPPTAPGAPASPNAAAHVEPPCTWTTSRTPAALGPGTSSPIPAGQFRSPLSHSPFQPQQHQPQNTRAREFFLSHDSRLQSVPVFPVPSRYHQHRAPPAFTLLPPIRSSPQSSSSLAQQPHPPSSASSVDHHYPRPHTPAKAHHVSLPPSASKNQFTVDFAAFSFDDLDLVAPDFDSRPPPDLRLSIDITASNPNPSSAEASCSTTLTSTRDQRPTTSVGPALPHRSSLRRRAREPIAVSTPTAKSRLSLTEGIWPRPFKTTLTEDTSIDKNHKSSSDKVPSVEASPHNTPEQPEEESFLPLSVAIPSDSLLDDDFLTGISFSKRGSVMLGGSRVISRSALEEYFKSTASAEAAANDANPAVDQTAQDTVLPSIENADTKPVISTEEPVAPTEQAQELPSSPPEPVSNWSWKDPPIIRKTSPTPSPSFSSLLGPRLPRDPTYDFIDVVCDQLASRTETPDTLLGDAPGHESDTTAGDPEPFDSDLDSPGIMAMAPTIPPASSGRRGMPDLEKESHKVRSLYEGGDSVCWEDGHQGSNDGNGPSSRLESSVAERLEPMPEAPEEANSQQVTRNKPINDAHLGETRSMSPSQRDSHRIRQEFELAGGLEDWQNVDSEDVDRYGFINPRNPDSRISTPTESRQQQMQGRSRKFAAKKESSLHSHSMLGRTPSRKISARSLNTQASEVSALSWRSTRSAARQAANLLPVNRERRWMDEAGDMLTLAPGISDISDDVDAGRISESLKRKEWQRIEKWRSMAIVRNHGVPGQGQRYDFDMKDPKLIERTWKGIPDCWRAAAWWSFLSQSAKEHGSAPSEEGIMSSFHALQTKPCTDDVQIDLDVPRTISGHIMFRRRYRGGQRLLFRVLHALALYFPEVGYVQGMASLAATLLSYFDEEQAFVMLVRLWTLRGLARLYSHGFDGLLDSLRELEGVWLGGKPVAKKMADLSIDPTAYGTRWYLTLFNLAIPFGAQLRIWDVFMLLGTPAIDGPLPPPPSAIAVTPVSAPRRSTINLMPARSKHTSASASASSSSSNPPPTRSGTGSKSIAGPAPPTPTDGLQVLHAAAAALIQALGDVLLDSDFENAMKALTSWIPVKDEDMLMRVTMAEYKTHFLNRKKKRLA
ncbi:hypothetical protein BROUX41_003068 [Berkeleyomyces rouxiae]|uniref:uncharacterized protein n=1 Tax=Berkeleyomyces rouxiae TaxID=2035830 RepID=UPI003B7D455D